MSYKVKHTDKSKSSIEVHETSMDDSLDVFLPGRIRLEWGEEINENFLRLLENFACSSDPNNNNNPNLSNVSIPTTNNQKLLANPVEGQLWFNTTNNLLYSYTGSFWKPYVITGGNYGANWGQIRHGEQLPLPVSPNGYQFSYDECIWSVSPFNYVSGFSSMVCTTQGYPSSAPSRVTMRYRSTLTGAVINGFVNYLIIGIKGNTNLGTFVSPPVTAAPPPTPTGTPVATPTRTPTGTIPNATPTGTPFATPTNTPNATPTRTPFATPTGTIPDATPTGTPFATPTGTPFATPTGTPNATPTNTPNATPTRTPTATATSTPTSTPNLVWVGGSPIRDDGCDLVGSANDIEGEPCSVEGSTTFSCVQVGPGNGYRKDYTCTAV